MMRQPYSQHKVQDHFSFLTQERDFVPASKIKDINTENDREQSSTIVQKVVLLGKKMILLIF